MQESYTLVFAALLLVFGTLADRFGRRRILVMGVVVFAVWGSTIGGMVAVGPLLGGWLTTYYAWRWAFGINVPLAVIIVVGVLALVAESKEAGAPRPIDVVGAILSVAVSASLVYGLIEGRNYGWWLQNPGKELTFGDWSWPFALSPIPLTFALTLLSGAAFVWWGLQRQRAGRSALLDFSLFAIPSFRNGNIAAMIVSGVFGQKLSPVAIVRVGIIAEIVGVAGLGLVITLEVGSLLMKARD